MIDLEKLRAEVKQYQRDNLGVSANIVIKLLDHIAQLEKDAARWRFLCEKYDVSLLTTFFGNGCINKKIDDVNRAIDTAMEAKQCKD